MPDHIFQDCFRNYIDSGTGGQPFWAQLAARWGYSSSESLRSQFRRELKLRGLQNIKSEYVEEGESNLPVIGVIDLETIPLAALTFGTKEQNISPSQLMSHGGLLSWSGKNLFSSHMYSDILQPDEIYFNQKTLSFEFDTYRIAQSLHEFMSSCHIVIGHNFRRFDRKVANTAFHDNKLDKLSYDIIDTYQIVLQNFDLPYYTLEYVNKRFGLRTKVSHAGMYMWRKCLAGDLEYMQKMLEYNQGDILATQELFWNIQPYATNLPNLSLYSNTIETKCFCRSNNFYRDGYFYTLTAKYEKYRCDRCGALSHGRKNLLTKQQKETIFKGL